MTPGVFTAHCLAQEVAPPRASKSILLGRVGVELTRVGYGFQRIYSGMGHMSRLALPIVVAPLGFYFNGFPGYPSYRSLPKSVFRESDDNIIVSLPIRKIFEIGAGGILVYVNLRPPSAFLLSMSAGTG